MSFISFAFLGLFAVVLVGRATIGRDKTHPSFVALLIAASVIFYGWHVPVYLAILLTSILIDFWAGRGIARLKPGSLRRRLLLVVSLGTNLGLLGFFKYANFAVAQLNALWTLNGAAPLPQFDVVLPMGISFYTFQSMSYTIDIYRGVLRPVDRFWNFFLFVSFFPQLVAGPIVRAKEFLYQVPRQRRLSWRVASEGLFLIIRGFFLKMVCADNLGWYVDRWWAAPVSSTILLVATIGFSFQILADFAGYSSIARGLGYLLGYRFPINFDSPYIATSFSNFWQRWHVTLSRWLRDYLYIPLGGNRISTARTYVNLMTVMLLGGLWHGAAVTFIIWGGLHGAALAVERGLGLQAIGGRPGRPVLKLCWYLVVQVTVLATWIVFRSRDAAEAMIMFQGILRFDFPATDLSAVTPLLAASPLVLMHARKYLVERGLAPACGPREKAVLAGVMFVATLLLYGHSSDFIYFQF